MKNRILIGIVSFIVGLGVSFLLGSFLRNIVIDLFQWTTNGNVRFIGKNFYLFNSPFYFLSFGLAFMTFGIEAIRNKTYNNLKNVVLWIGVFIIVLIAISAFDANQKVMECTACENGIKMLRYNDVDYDFILGICALLSGLPSLVRLKKIELNLVYTNVYDDYVP